MLARIKFVNSYSMKNQLSNKELENLEVFLGEKVNTVDLVMKSDGSLDQFMSYKHKYEDSDDEDKELVQRTDMKKINDDNYFLVILEKFMQEFPNLEINIKGVPKSIDTSYSDVIRSMEEISKKIEAAHKMFNETVEFNNRVDVHVPNLGLMNVNKLAFATDYCTEQLQRLLDKGWRILVICPQPDQRRPDYILGMSVVGENEDVNVEHFSGSGREESLN